MVTKAVEERNKARLLDDCHKKVDGATVEKTKTSHIVNHIKDPNYRRKPQEILSNLSKQETKSLIIARFAMLECGQNYGGTLSQKCSKCASIDDEDHRLNHCQRYSHLNYSNAVDKIDFRDVFSEDTDKIRSVMSAIGNVWDLKRGHGTMNVE